MAFQVSGPPLVTATIASIEQGPDPFELGDGLIHDLSNVTFDPDSVLNRFDAYFGLKEALEVIFERPVDLVAPSALDNPYFARSVEATRINLYAA